VATLIDTRWETPKPQNPLVPAQTIDVAALPSWTLSSAV
jgi:hypothetical protein